MYRFRRNLLIRAIRPSALFDHFKEMGEVVSISIPSFLIKWGLGIVGMFKNMQINIGGAGSLIPPGLCKSAETIRIATTEDAETAKKMREMFGEFIDKSEFSEFVRSNEKSEKSLIYIHMDENSARLLISAEEQCEFSVVYPQGKNGCRVFYRNYAAKNLKILETAQTGYSNIWLN